MLRFRLAARTLAHSNLIAALAVFVRPSCYRPTI